MLLLPAPPPHTCSIVCVSNGIVYLIQLICCTRFSRFSISIIFHAVNFNLLPIRLVHKHVHKFNAETIEQGQRWGGGVGALTGIEIGNVELTNE